MIKKAIWIVLAVVVTACLSVSITVVLMSKTSRDDYRKQMIAQNNTIVELAKIAKYSISNTYTVKKVKGQFVVVPENNMNITETAKGLDSLIVRLNAENTSTIDTGNIKKTFWQKLKFWED